LDGERNIIVIDSQGEMIPLIQSLKVFKEELEGRLIVIDPDPEHPPALNIFGMGKGRHKSYSTRDREQLANTTSWLINYIFGTIGKSAELTSKQDNVFTYCIELLQEVPDATLRTFEELLRAPDLRYFEPSIRTLRDGAQKFLRTDFMDEKLYGSTKKEVLWRIQALLKTPTFERMLCAPDCKIDLFEKLNEGGKVILINTDLNLLQAEQSAAFGRFWLAMIVAATTERVVLDRESRIDTRVYVDEAHEYVGDDKATLRLLDQARKMKVGLICATQRTSKIGNPDVLDALCNAGILFASTTNQHDTNRLAPSMGYLLIRFTHPQ